MITAKGNLRPEGPAVWTFIEGQVGEFRLVGLKASLYPYRPGLSGCEAISKMLPFGNPDTGWKPMLH